MYDTREQPLQTGGNIYCRGARPYAKEANPLVLSGSDPQLKVVEEGDRVFLQFHADPEWKRAATTPVRTALLGKAKIPNLPYENVDGSPLIVDTDFFGAQRSGSAPAAGPFENPGSGELKLQVR